MRMRENGERSPRDPCSSRPARRRGWSKSAPPFGRLAMERWRNSLMTTLQYRVYLERPAAAIAYRTMELHYYTGHDGRQIIGWMFPKRDHLAIGLGVMGKMAGEPLRAELDAFAERVRARLYPGGGVRAVKTEGHLLYGGMARPSVRRRCGDGGRHRGGNG